MATEIGVYNSISTIHKGIIPNKLHESLRMLNLLPALRLLLEKAFILNTCP